MSARNVIITTRWTAEDVERIDWMCTHLRGKDKAPLSRSDVIRAALYVLHARMRERERNRAA